MKTEVKTYRGSYHKKVTEEMKLEFKELREQGLSYKKIADVYGLSRTTVHYHLDDNMKELLKKGARKASREKRLWRNKNPDKNRAWANLYMIERYNNDDEFRERVRRNAASSYRARKDSLIVVDEER